MGGVIEQLGDAGEQIVDSITSPVTDVIEDVIDTAEDIIGETTGIITDYLFGDLGAGDNDVAVGNDLGTNTIPGGGIGGGGGGGSGVDGYGVPPGLRTSPFTPSTYGLPIIYGTRETKGQAIFRETSADNKNLYLYYALCEGQLASAPTVTSDPASLIGKTSYIEKELTVGSDGGFDSDIAESRKDIFQNSGSAGTTEPTNWTTSHRAKGVAMGYFRFTYDQTEMNRMPRLTFTVTGRSITGNDDNPVNQLKDYLTNTRFGAGVASSLIDDTSFNTARDYCDNTDSAGRKRFTSNIILDSRATVLANIRRLLQTCTGQLHFRNGKYYMHIDGQSSSTVFDFDLDNIIGGIKVSKAGKTQRFNRALVTFTDPDNDYQSTEVQWPDNGESAYSTYLSQDNNKVLEKRINTAGITNIQQARYIGQIVVRQSRLGTTVTLVSTAAAADVVPGDLVRLTHPTFGFSNKHFRVRTVKALSGVGIQFMMTEHDNAVYDRDVLATPAAPSRMAHRDSSVISAVSGLTGTEVIYTSRDGAGVKNKVTLNWNDISDNFLAAYEVSFKLGSASDFQAVAETQETTIDVNDLGPGTFDFRVISRNIEGTKSSASVVTVVCTGLPVAPQQMTGLRINSLGPTVALAQWNLSESLDVQQAGFYRIAHSVDETVTNWDNGVVITQQIAGNQTSAIVPLLAGTYLIRATDSSGQKSLGDSFVHDGTSLQELTNLQTIQEDPTFSGSKTKLVVTDNYLKIVSAANIDEISDFDAIEDMDSLNGVYARSGGNWPGQTPLYEFSQYLDLGSVQNVRLASFIKFFTTNYQDKIDTWGNIDDRIDFDGVNEGLTDIDIQFAQTDDDPNASPTWGEFQDFYVTETKARGFKFRVFPITDDSSHNVVIQNLRVFAQQLSA